MMLTYSLSEMIFGQILLPTKREKFYLFAILGGSVLNLVLSIVFGGVLPNHVAWLTPAIGVAIATVITDILIALFLISITWKWTKNAIFNKNTVKLLAASVAILIISALIYKPLHNLWLSLNLGGSGAALLDLVVILAIDAVIYLVLLAIMKEDLVYSFIRKKKPTEAGE